MNEEDEYREIWENMPEPEPETIYEALDRYLETATNEDLVNLMNYFEAESYYDLRFYFQEGSYFRVDNGIKDSFAVTRNGKKTLLYPFKILLKNRGCWLGFNDFKADLPNSITKMDKLVVELRKNTFQKLKISNHIHQNSDWLEYDRDKELIRLTPEK